MFGADQLIPLTITKMHLLINVTLLLISFTLSANAYIPLFIRGRPRGGFLGVPKEVEIPVNFALPADNWFEQRLNHFDSAELRTWKQRYFFNSSLFNRKKNGPVFLMIGGEGTANAIWTVVGSMMKYAERYGALCFLLEHRFYGKSHPLG